VNYHSGESIVLFRRRKRRREIAELLQAILVQNQRSKVE
jgi:hypothetical protein